MTERPVTKIELLLLALGVGLLCGLAVLNPGREQREAGRNSDREKFLTTTPELRAPLNQKWYGLPRDYSTAFPEGEPKEDRLY